MKSCIPCPLVSKPIPPFYAIYIYIYQENKVADTSYLRLLELNKQTAKTCTDTRLWYIDGANQMTKCLYVGKMWNVAIFLYTVSVIDVILMTQTDTSRTYLFLFFLVKNLGFVLKKKLFFKEWQSRTRSTDS